MIIIKKEKKYILKEKKIIINQTEIENTHQNNRFVKTFDIPLFFE